MEIKKSHKADLERKRTLWFFVGLIINISVFVILLEWTPSEGEITTETLKKYVDNVAETVEMIPAEEAVPEKIIKEQNKEEKTVSDIIEVVDNTEITEDVKPAGNAGNNTIEIPGKEDIEKPIERKEIVTDIKLLEQIPSYPGGMSKFVKWLTGMLRYPESARRDKLEGLVSASFVIEEDGSITDLKITHSLRRDCDDEVLRVLLMMKPWQPGIKNGKPCRTLFCIPIEFKL